MCNTFEQKRLKFNKIITARVIFYIIDLFAECEQSFLAVPSSPAAAGASPRRSLRFRTANSMFSYIDFIKIEICFSKFLP